MATQGLDNQDEPERSGGGYAGGGHRGNGDGGDDIAVYRLDQMEHRLRQIEADVKSINETVVKVNTKMDALATKEYVLTIFGITGGFAILTFIGHLLLRTLG